MIPKKRTTINFLLPHSVFIIPYLVIVSCFVILVFSKYYEHPNPKVENVVAVGTSNVVLGEKDIFIELLDEYKSDLSSLDDNIKLQSIMILIAFLLVLRSSDKLSFFSNDVPLRWLHFFVPILLIYLWLRFGFLLDDLIEERKQAVTIIFESNLESQFKDAAKAIFNDGGFIDGWILSYEDQPGLDYSGIEPSFKDSTKVFLIITLGLFISSGHASIMALTIIGIRRYVDLNHKNWLFLYYLLPLLPLGLLLSSNLQYVYGGSNDTDVSIFVALSVWPILMFLLWKALKVDNKRYPLSINKLKRNRALHHPGPKYSSSRKKKTPHFVALMGDSLSTGFHVNTFPKMFYSFWFSWKGNWYIDTLESNNAVQSVFERIGGYTPFTAFQHACATAQVKKEGWRSIKDIFTNTWHFSHQTSELLAGKFPHLILIWMGHNSLDWYKEDITDFDTYSQKFITNYETQIDRIVSRGVVLDRKTAIVIYGLINFKSFFNARSSAEELKKNNNSLYPFLERDYDFFISMKPNFRNNMIILAQKINEKIENLCLKINGNIEGTNVRLVYSNAMSDINIDNYDNLNNYDAWHPSFKAHRRIAKSAFEPIEECLKFLEWD